MVRHNRTTDITFVVLIGIILVASLVFGLAFFFARPSEERLPAYESHYHDLTGDENEHRLLFHSPRDRREIVDTRR